MVTDKDVVFLSKRIKELADRAFKSNIVTNTFFLNLNEQTVFFSIKNLPDINGSHYLILVAWENFIFAFKKLAV